MLSVQPLHKQLLPWFKKNARPMPWRETKDPYKIWVSEIMLQQTQVQTVIPYYQKWTERFPNLASLASAPEEDVMKFWAGLGYYRRARMLHKAAQILWQRVMSNEQRVKKGFIPPPFTLPSAVPELLELPGIGRYTAGAIASIAFDLKAPILDGNVIRILTRIFALKDDIAKPKTLAKLWGISESLLPDKNTGDFNQAMMELGATVCTPQNPRCGICPVQKNCLASASGTPEDFPVKSNREKLEKIKTAAFILKNNGKVLLEKQPSEGRWGGLWMFPHGKTKQEVARRFKIGEKESLKALTVSHGFTKYRVQLDVYENKGTPRRNTSKSTATKRKEKIVAALLEGVPGFKWFNISELDQLPLPAPHKKIAAHLVKL